jgi:hypothetical protein
VVFCLVFWVSVWQLYLAFYYTKKDSTHLYFQHVFLHFISCSLRTRQAPSQEARNSARWQEEGKAKEAEEKSKLT